MYIIPNTTIKLIKMCPLDSSYQNTILFNSPTDQTNYFINTLSGYTFQNNTYQRVNKGVIRVEKKADLLYDCNYLAFQNTAYGNKWFYAFIKKIEYVNNVTSEVYYEIDLIQTWQFNWVLEQCFVEREHSATDIIGENLVEENLDTGEYISDAYDMPSILNDYKIIFWCTFDRGYDNVGGSDVTQGYQAMYSGLTPIDFPLTSAGISSAIAWLGAVPVFKQQGIVTACIVPTLFNTALDRDITITKSSSIQRSDNHAIKNNKLYTYPYNFLYVTNSQGRSAVYRYEFFNSQQCVFGAFADTSPQASAIIYPRNYKGVSNNFDERLSLSGYPQIGYNIDAYKAWLAQNLSSLGTNAALAGLATGAIGAPTTAPLLSAETALAPYGAAGSLAETGVATVGGVTAASAAGLAIPLAALCMKALQGTIHALMPPQAHGTQGGSVELARGILNFGFMHKHITDEFVTIIDDYFNMYGYATHKVKVPNIGSRPEWNYVKTIGCSIYGELPSDDARAIEGIFDRGIRFWKTPSHIGNYGYDNSPSA